MRRTVLIRLSGTAFVLASAWYLPWVVLRLDPGALWLGVPFVVATATVALGALLALVNNWTRTVPEPRPVAPGREPRVAVIVTTAGEDPAMVEATARSVLDQDWPDARTWLVVSDDAGQPTLQEMVDRLAAEHPDARIDYHRPPARGTPQRRGAAKAGNLNSALDLILAGPEPVPYVETRDADDLVGTPAFLRAVVGQLESDALVAYVQTTKAVPRGRDPFANAALSLFRGSMLGRNAANAVFPCGSGLVWRSAALRSIGGFPADSVVEDLQSGILALGRGWTGVYLPIVGARAQHQPEDIPNVYKQRGTWAVDTLAILRRGGVRDLALRQRLQFWELGVFYVQSLALLAIMAITIVGLMFGVYPVDATWSDHTLHFWPFAVTLEALLAALFACGRMEAYLREREQWIGLSPVFARACVDVAVGRRRPYRLTRKHDEFRWYWRETLPQAAILAGLLAGVALAVATHSPLDDLDLATVYWALVFAGFLAAFVAKGWYGTASPLARLVRHARRARPVRGQGAEEGGPGRLGPPIRGEREGLGLGSEP